MELTIRCQYGERRKNGKTIRPATCPNKASGIFRVAYVKGRPKLKFLCAGCAFDKVPNHVQMVTNDDGETIHFRDVVGVELVTSLNTKFDQSSQPGRTGDKWWVEPPPKEEDWRPRKVKVKVYKDTPSMDLTKYRDSLRRHDDDR